MIDKEDEITKQSDEEMYWESVDEIMEMFKLNHKKQKLLREELIGSLIDPNGIPIFIGNKEDEK